MTDPSDNMQQRDGALPVSEMIRRRVSELPRAERRVGRALLVHSPTIGLESSSRLAEIVGTSGPTVIRFVNRLGFSTYAAFQRAWRDELDARLVSPVDSYRQYEPETDAMRRVARTADQSVQAIRESVAQLPPGEFETAVELLASRRRVVVFGGWFSHVLARHLVALLQNARPEVSHLEQPPVQRSATLVDAGRHVVAVVFDFRRYEQDTLVAAQHLADRGAPIVLVTDQWISPVAGLASSVLIARAAPTPLDSMSSAMVLCQALAAAIVDRLGPEVVTRIEHLAEISSTLIANWSAPGE
jgi:DNA-binding MurR/RpiR family transcriptional regulator